MDTLSTDKKGHVRRVGCKIDEATYTRVLNLPRGFNLSNRLRNALFGILDEAEKASVKIPEPIKEPVKLA